MMPVTKALFSVPWPVRSPGFAFRRRAWYEIKMPSRLLLAILLALALCSHSEGADLSPDEAARLVREALEVGKDSEFIRQYERTGALYPVTGEKRALQGYRTLEKEGFLKLRPFKEETREGEQVEAFGIQFTEKADPYVRKSNGDSENRAYLSLARVENLDVTGIRPLNPREYKAEVHIGYRLTPFGEILLGRGVILERKQDAFFEAHDNGWRVKFKASF